MFDYNEHCGYCRNDKAHTDKQHNRAISDKLKTINRREDSLYKPGAETVR